MNTALEKAEQFDVLVVAAGKPHSGQIPAILQQASVGRRVLDWILDVYLADAADITVVAGYHADEIRQHYPDLQMIVNEEWENTGSLQSIMLAQPSGSRPLFVNYGDVLVRKELIQRMNGCDAGVVIAIDSAWHQRYGQDSAETMNAREKVSVVGDEATRLGYDLPVEWASGEFVGVVRFSPEALDLLKNPPNAMPSLGPHTSLSEALEYMRAHGEHIKIVDVMGQWVEVNNSRDIAYFVLGTKADTLQRLHSVLTTAIIQEVCAITVAEWRADPDAVMAAIRSQFATLNGNLVVRSSARSEDTFDSSNAGGYDSVLDVDPETGLAAAIEQVIASYGEASADDQVLVQPMLEDVRLSGVIFTRTSEHYAPWYVINYEVSGRTDGVTSGTSDDHLTLHVNRDAKPGSLPVPELEAVLAAIREIEDKLGYDALDIEFALDGDGKVHILQVRPIAIKPQNGRADDESFRAVLQQARRTWNRLLPTPPHFPDQHAPVYSVMTDWNPAEIIGTAPGKLAETLYRFLIMDHTWARQRHEYGYRDLRSTPLLVTFAGRPYVDVRASLCSFIPATLDDDLAGRLLTYYLDRLRRNPALHDKVEFDIVPTCLAADFDRWSEQLQTEGGFTPAEVETLRQALHGITQAALTRCGNDLTTLEELGRRHARIMAGGFDPIERARLLLEVCRSYGALPFAHLARSGFVAVTLLRGAENIGVISEQARAAFLSTIRSVSHDFTADARAVANGKLSWEGFVAKYGHLRPGTYDISSPRYDSDPNLFLRPQVETATHEMQDDHTQGAVDVTAWERERPAFLQAMADMGLSSDAETVETFLRQAIEGREYSKFIFTRSFSDAIEALAEAGEALGLDRTALSNLPLSRLLELRDDQSPTPDQLQELRELAAKNARKRALAAAVKLPPVVVSEEDFDSFLVGAEIANFVGQDEVIADCVDLELAQSDKTVSVKGCIAMIPQADPGYDWLFGQGIVGLVTMYGGVNSHMAIRAAEFGMSAAIGIGEKRYRELAGAKFLHLDPRNQVLKTVS